MIAHLGKMSYIFNDKQFLKALQFLFSQDISKKLFRKKYMYLLGHNKKHFIRQKLKSVKWEFGVSKLSLAFLE